MSQHGARLQSHNNELVQYVEDLRSHRHELDNVISGLEANRNDMDAQMDQLQGQMYQLEEELQGKYELRTELVKTLETAEDAYESIVETSQSLVNSLKRDSALLMKATGSGKSSPRKNAKK